MSIVIRINALTPGGDGPRTLSAQEAHGKRTDQTSQARRVRDTPSLVHGTLNLRTAYGHHVKGCRRTRNLVRPVLHGLFQFPTSVPLLTEQDEQRLAGRIVAVGGRQDR